jgi:hypothetical protein
MGAGMNTIVFKVASKSGDECLFQAGADIKQILEQAGAGVSVSGDTDPRLKDFIQKHGRHVTTDGGLLGLDVEVSITSDFPVVKENEQERMSAFIADQFASGRLDENLYTQGFRSWIIMREYEHENEDVSDRDMLMCGKFDSETFDSEIGQIFKKEVERVLKDENSKVHSFGSGEGGSGRGRDWTYWVQIERDTLDVADNGSVVLILSHR